MKMFENRRRRASSNRIADDEIAAIEKELLAALKDDDECASRDITADSLVEDAGKLEKYATTLPDDKDIVKAKEDDEVQEVLASCDSLERKIAVAARRTAARTMISAEEKEKRELNDEIASCEKAIDQAEKKASVEKKGIEDEIGNEAFGEDPSVSTAVKSDVDCETLKRAVSSNSEYVAKRCTAKLDRCADILEKRGMKRFAFAIDKLSDEIEASLRKH